MKPGLRAKGDEELLKRLLGDPTIKSAVKTAQEATDTGVRRELLASSVRITPRILPRLDAIVRDAKALLSIDSELELYIYADASFNAACVRPEGGRAFLMFSSALIEAFDDHELAFVVGHELGHHMFAHHEVPVQQLSRDSQLQGATVLELYAWSRYAEISADRAGLACVGELDGAARAFFKLSSGLKTGVGAIHADDLIAQLTDMPEESKARDWFSTHPFSPLRLRAAKSFMSSELAKSGGASLTDLELETEELMALMQPRYLEEKSEAAEAMRRLLRAGGVRVAAVSGGISAEEIAQLEKFFGAGSFSGKINAEALVRDLDRRIGDVKDAVPLLRRVQVLRDLCLIAKADGTADEAERAVLEDIARSLEIDPTIVGRTLDARVRLD